MHLQFAAAVSANVHVDRATGDTHGLLDATPSVRPGHPYARATHRAVGDVHSQGTRRRESETSRKDTAPNNLVIQH